MLAWLAGGGRVSARYERGKVSGLTLLMSAARYGHEQVVAALYSLFRALRKQDPAPRRRFAFPPSSPSPRRGFLARPALSSQVCRAERVSVRK